MKNLLSDKELEQFYEEIIDSSYDLESKNIEWVSHDKIGLDTFAHYFRYNGDHYTFVFEDFPGEAHFIAEDSDEIPTRSGDATVHIAPSNGEYIENKTGYFTLYIDKSYK